MLKFFLCMKHLTTLYVYSSWDVRGIWPKGGIGRFCSTKTSLPWAVLLLRQKLLLMPWHDAFVFKKMWYGLYKIGVRYTLLLMWRVDFVWFCVSLRHIIYKHCWYLGSWLDEFELHAHTHAITKILQNQNPWFSEQKKTRLFLMSYVFIGLGFFWNFGT